MEIRPFVASDIDRLADIDATVESNLYLHLGRSGEGLRVAWNLEERPLRTAMVEPNDLGEDLRFSVRQIVNGMEEGLALCIEHDKLLVGSLVAVVRAESRLLEVVDVRVDYDVRRQGLGTAMLFRAIQFARENKLRAVMTRTLTNNIPAARFFAKAGFDLSGLDALFTSNHDLVKEAVTLFWYATVE